MDIVQDGDRYRITKIVRSDPDSYAVIYYGDRWAFGCGKEWFDLQQPTVGGEIIAEDWPSPTRPSFIYRWKVTQPRHTMEQQAAQPEAGAGA